MENKVVFTNSEKETIGKMVVSLCDASGMSATKWARTVGMNKTDISNLRGKRWIDNPTLIGEAKWIKLGRLVKYTNRPAQNWIVAPTKTYERVTYELSVCQKYSISRTMVDEVGIGKTTACIDYKEKNKEVIYIRCSKFPGKYRFITALGKALGVYTENQCYQDILEDAIYTIKLMKTPLLILDEAGDLDNSMERLLKEIWNELEGICGIYKVGSQSLRKRMERGVGLDKIGFAESVSRWGSDYSKVAPSKRKKYTEYLKFIRSEAEIMLATNGFSKEVCKKLISCHAHKDLRPIKEGAIIYRAEIGTN